MITSYAETVRHFIFPAININWLVIFILVISGYLCLPRHGKYDALCHYCLYVIILDGVPFYQILYTPDRFLD